MLICVFSFLRPRFPTWSSCPGAAHHVRRAGLHKAICGKHFHQILSPLRHKLDALLQANDNKSPLSQMPKRIVFGHQIKTFNIGEDGQRRICTLCFRKDFEYHHDYKIKTGAEYHKVKHTDPLGKLAFADPCVLLSADPDHPRRPTHFGDSLCRSLCGQGDAEPSPLAPGGL
jgi:hypothetical protein